MSPELIMFIAKFSSELIEDYRSSNVVLTLEEIANQFEAAYNEAIINNDRLLKETE